MSYREALLIENDSEPDEYISSYIDKNCNQPEWYIDYLFKLKWQDELDIKTKFWRNNTYIFSTTFSNREQNQKIIELIGSQDDPKDIFIHYLTDDLYLGLHESLPKDFHPKKYGFDKHTIYGIHRKTKVRQTGEFFNQHIHYFDTIEYYWNDDFGAYLPERPTCFFDSNLNSGFKYKPIWVSRDSKIKH